MRKLLISSILLVVTSRVVGGSSEQQELRPHPFTDEVFSGWRVSDLAAVVEQKEREVATLGKAGVLTGFGEDKRFSQAVYGLAEGPDGSIWITHNGISRIVGNTLISYSTQTGRGELLSTHPDPLIENNRVWFASTRGGAVVYEMEPGKKPTWLRYFTGEPPPAGDITSVFKDGRGDVWWGGFANSVWRIRDKEVELIRRDSERDSHIIGIVEDAAGTLWFGAHKHGDPTLVLFSIPEYRRNSVFTCRYAFPLDPWVFPLRATCFTFDESGTIWVGTDHIGLVRISSGLNLNHCDALVQESIPGGGRRAVVRAWSIYGPRKEHMAILFTGGHGHIRAPL